MIPLYVLAVLAWAALHPELRPAVPAHLLLYDGQRHFWTVAVEVRFYFVLPLLIYAGVMLPRRFGLPGVVAAVAAIAAVKFGFEPLEAVSAGITTSG